MGDSLQTYIALLRGINVGSKNIIPMKELSNVFYNLGFINVLTYIRSGNVLFQSNKKDIKILRKLIENAVLERFAYKVPTIVYSRAQYIEIVKDAPPDWGKDDIYRHRILFVLDRVSPKEILEQLDEPDESIEILSAGPRAIYSMVHRDRLTKSVLSKLTRTQYYDYVTIRNHNTVFKINQLLNNT
jgi:uncharacterized protein (DUF1697 family)